MALVSHHRPLRITFGGFRGRHQLVDLCFPADIVEKVENNASAQISLKSAQGEPWQEKPSQQN